MKRMIQSMEEKYLLPAHESVGLPAPECLMVRELIPGGLEGIRGQVCYADYDCLR